MERKLATIQRVLSVESIPDADKIETVKILGWAVVCKKEDQIKVDQKIVYCSIDSVLPESNPYFEFLKDKKYRIKTCKFRGALSQGICFPMSILPSGDYKEGDDITEILGIKLYEPLIPAYLHGLVEGFFPSYIPKTDEIRIQSEPGLLEELKGKICYITVKVDGTSATFSHNNGEIKICGRNLAYKEESTNAYCEIFKRYDLGNKLKELGNYGIQGEIAGCGIQKNPLGLKQIDFFAFNVFDINAYQHLGYKEFVSICAKLGVKTVPILTDTFVFNHSIEQLLELSKGVYEGTKTPREGIVIRPLETTLSIILNGRLSVKVINNVYLLKCED